jgi:hypothetical protein
VIIYDLDIVSVALLPLKTDAPLVVDANIPLTCSLPNELFQMIGQWDSQIIDGESIVNHSKFLQCDLLNIKRQLARRLALVNLLSGNVFETLYHSIIL